MAPKRVFARDAEAREGRGRARRPGTGPIGFSDNQGQPSTDRGCVTVEQQKTTETTGIPTEITCASLYQAYQQYPIGARWKKTFTQLPFWTSLARFSHFSPLLALGLARGRRCFVGQSRPAGACGWGACRAAPCTPACARRARPSNSKHARPIRSSVFQSGAVALRFISTRPVPVPAAGSRFCSVYA
jgi:hypothetical protein